MTEQSGTLKQINPWLAMIKLDLIALRAITLPVVLLLVAMAVFITIVNDDIFVPAPMLIPIFIFMPLNAFSHDDYYPLPKLYGALPVSRQVVITVRYLVTMGWVVLGAVCVGVLLLLSGNPIGHDLLPVVALAFSALSMVLAIMIPIMVRFGSKNAIWGFFGIGFLGGIITAGIRFSPLAASIDINMLQNNLRLLAGGAVVVAVICFALSWMISLRIYLAQDH